MHSEANSSIFVEFGRIEIVSSVGIQIKKKWGSGGRKNMHTIKNFHSSTRLDRESPVALSTQPRACGAK